LTPSGRPDLFCPLEQVLGQQRRLLHRREMPAHLKLRPMDDVVEQLYTTTRWNRQNGVMWKAGEAGRREASLIGRQHDTAFAKHTVVKLHGRREAVGHHVQRDIRSEAPQAKDRYQIAVPEVGPVVKAFRDSRGLGQRIGGAQPGKRVRLEGLHHAVAAQRAVSPARELEPRAFFVVLGRQWRSLHRHVQMDATNGRRMAELQIVRVAEFIEASPEALAAEIERCKALALRKARTSSRNVSASAP
jgi:hypothetical protein